MSARPFGRRQFIFEPTPAKSVIELTQRARCGFGRESMHGSPVSRDGILNIFGNDCATDERKNIKPCVQSTQIIFGNIWLHYICANGMYYGCGNLGEYSLPTWLMDNWMHLYPARFNHSTSKKTVFNYY